MELIIDFDNIGDTSKKEWLIRTLKLMGIGFHTSEKPQTLQEYNQELEKGDAEIQQGNFITATDLKNEAGSW
jgi:hypothetical protein